MGWADFVGRAFTRDQFSTYLGTLKWTMWKPKGCVVHNTAAPTLEQWAESGPNHDARIRNLKAYYQNEKRWHGAPHFFISRDWINVFDGLLEPGVHSPSFNDDYFGIEMVGNYDREPFNSGDGAKVRDNTVFVISLLCRRHNFNPDRNIKLHKEDPRTTHDCPGKFVKKADLIARVKAEIARQEGRPVPKIPDGVDGEPSPPPKWTPPAHDAFQDDKGKPRRMTNITATVFGYPGDENKSEQRGAYNNIIDHNKPGCALPFKWPSNKRPWVRVFYKSGSVVCQVIDRGPWNHTDPYWDTPGRRPAVERQMGRERAENGRVPTNDAAIDLTPGAARKLGLVGKGKVDWEFVQPVSGTGAAVGTGAAIGTGGAAVVVGKHIKDNGLSVGSVMLISVLMIGAAAGVYFLVKWLRGR